jgi:hypothetical protein
MGQTCCAGATCGVTGLVCTPQGICG